MASAQKAISGPGGFGRRGTIRTPPRPASKAIRRSGAAPPAADGPSTISVVADDITTSASRGKAFFKACFAATTTFIAMIFLFGDVDSKIFGSSVMLAFLAVPLIPTLMLVLCIPAIVLSDVARLLSVPRGWSDIGIGLVLGAGIGVGIALTSPDQKALMTALATTAGGFVGGLAFWRAQGYPGTSSGVAAAFDHAYDKMT